jgi:hypothetical protein
VDCKVLYPAPVIITYVTGGTSCDITTIQAAAADQSVTAAAVEEGGGLHANHM